MFSLEGDNFVLEMRLRFAYNTCGPFTKSKERMQEVLSVQVIFIMKNYRNPAFEMIWVTEFSRTRLEEQVLIKYSLLPNRLGSWNLRENLKNQEHLVTGGLE